MEIYVCPFCGYSVSLVDVSPVDADKASTAEQMKRAFEEKARAMDLMQEIEMQKMQIEKCQVELEQGKSVLNAEGHSYQDTDKGQKLSAHLKTLQEKRMQLEINLAKSQAMLATLENEKSQMECFVCPKCGREFKLSEARRKTLKSDGKRFSKEDTGAQKAELAEILTVLKTEREHIARVQADLEQKKAAMLADRSKTEEASTQADVAAKTLDEEIMMTKQKRACLEAEIACSQKMLDDMGGDNGG